VVRSKSKLYKGTPYRKSKGKAKKCIKKGGGFVLAKRGGKRCPGKNDSRRDLNQKAKGREKALCKRAGLREKRLESICFQNGHATRKKVRLQKKRGVEKE